MTSCKRCWKVLDPDDGIHTCSPPPIVAEHEATIAQLVSELDMLKAQCAEYCQRAEQAEAQVAALRSLLAEVHQSAARLLAADEGVA